MTDIGARTATRGCLMDLTPMHSQRKQQPMDPYSVLAPAAHVLHECRNAEEFHTCFESSTGSTVQAVVDRIVVPAAPRAVFLTGSLPLGMGTIGSDVDFVVLIDSQDAIRPSDTGRRSNTSRNLTFSGESDSLRPGLFITVMGGITVEVAAVLTPHLKRIFSRLRSKGPDLSENEIMTLGRLATGWLLSQSDRYLERCGITLDDPAFNVYCSTRYFTYARIYGLKAPRALDLSDIPQALHLGRLSVEMAYLAYFASEGFPYLGAKWLAQLGHARGAAERVSQHPLLEEGIALLFPMYKPDPQDARPYLQAVADFLLSMQALIGRKTLFRIAFEACPQIKAH